MTTPTTANTSNSVPATEVVNCGECGREFSPSADEGFGFDEESGRHFCPACVEAADAEIERSNRPLTVAEVIERGWIKCGRERSIATPPGGFSEVICVGRRPVDKRGEIGDCPTCHAAGGRNIHTKMVDRQGQPIKTIYRSRSALREPVRDRRLSREQQRRLRQLQRKQGGA